MSFQDWIYFKPLATGLIDLTCSANSSQYRNSLPLDPIQSKKFRLKKDLISLKLPYDALTHKDHNNMVV